MQKVKGGRRSRAATIRPKLPAPSPCYFVSDLHLLSRRTQGYRYLDVIRTAASAADHFVLGGDIFDFRWARTPTLDEAFTAATSWLNELTSVAPQCGFHFVLGNHDHHDGFRAHLDELAGEIANFSWHDYYVRIGSAVFLHGDVADREMDAAMLAAFRAQDRKHKRKGRVAETLYGLFVMSQLHRPLPYLRHRPRVVARRILAYLKEVGHGPETGVKNVYFGHTHWPLADFKQDGVSFHNGGAPIRDPGFRIVPAVIE